MAEKEVDVVVRKDGEVVVASCAGLSILFIYPPKTNREEREIERGGKSKVYSIQRGVAVVLGLETREIETGRKIQA